MSLKKLKKKITSKTGQPLDERKLFHNAQAMQGTLREGRLPENHRHRLPPAIDERAPAAARSPFEIHETAKVKIKDVVFVNATANTQKELRNVLKTRRHWMFSWLTGIGRVEGGRI